MERYMNKLEKSIDIMNYLANGVNPINKEELEFDERLINCFGFVQEALEELSEFKKQEREKKFRRIKREEKKARRYLPMKIDTETKEKIKEELMKTENIYISGIAKIINEYTDKEKCRMINGADINKGLLDRGYLKVEVYENGRRYKKPTEKGKNFGINLIPCTNRKGQNFLGMIYTGEILEYIVENIEELVEKQK